MTGIHDTPRMRLGIAGAGRAAWAFGSTWRRLGLPLAGIWHHSGTATAVSEALGVHTLSPASLAGQSDLILIAVHDAAIRGIAAKLLPSLRTDTGLFHCSGLLGTSALASHPVAFSLHPLQALPAVGEPVDLSETLLAYEGPDPMPEHAQRMISALGGPWFRIDEQQKPLYHAAAVLASNHVAALLEISAKVLTSVGVPRDQSARSVSALATSALENWSRHGDARRFTGPVARADLETIERHLEALSADSVLRTTYLALSVGIAASLAEGSHAQESWKLLRDKLLAYLNLP